ncbi:hypothetical protein NP233_g6451 [Leucocoprinus birnbaumii]|uniref:Uncharacterized protein n=1 Tax=Leucocoprinus birnbaumii TaxID=56174 RepID=A0AAD5VUI1_9AGAR|nr:hypothetical protein NP233_g6451 [Leucocoprinus birnbaumii]
MLSKDSRTNAAKPPSHELHAVGAFINGSLDSARQIMWYDSGEHDEVVMCESLKDEFFHPVDEIHLDFTWIVDDINQVPWYSPPDDQTQPNQPVEEDTLSVADASNEDVDIQEVTEIVTSQSFDNDRDMRDITESQANDLEGQVVTDVSQSEPPILGETSPSSVLREEQPNAITGPEASQLWSSVAKEIEFYDMEQFLDFGEAVGDDEAAKEANKTQSPGREEINTPCDSRKIVDLVPEEIFVNFDGDEGQENGQRGCSEREEIEMAIHDDGENNVEHGRKHPVHEEVLVSREPSDEIEAVIRDEHQVVSSAQEEHEECQGRPKANLFRESFVDLEAADSEEEELSEDGDGEEDDEDFLADDQDLVEEVSEYAR